MKMVKWINVAAVVVCIVFAANKSSKAEGVSGANVTNSLKNGLIAFYPLNGNARDESGNENHGVEFGGVSYAEGIFGDAAKFDGSDDFIEVDPQSDVSSIGDFTISVWTFLEDWKSQNYPVHYGMDRQYIFDGHSHSKTTGTDFYRPGFGLIYDGNSSAQEIHDFILFDNGLFTEQNTRYDVKGAWLHHVFMRRGINDLTYINGQLISSTYSRNNKSDSPLNMQHTWFIGTFSGNNPYYNNGVVNYSFFGLIDELLIYNRALEEDEIGKLYHEGMHMNTPPSAQAGPDRHAEMISCSGASVSLDGSGSSDPDGDALTYTWTENGVVIATGVNPTVSLSYDSHAITLTVDDGKGGTASDDVIINVVDTIAPVLNVTLSPDVLWPPNHKYVKVTPSITASDACMETTKVELVSATSNEPDNGPGDGDTARDIVINTDGTISLRAERSGAGSGRVYMVTYRVKDIAGNATAASASATAPHDAR